jgi:hypothetical protein
MSSTSRKPREGHDFYETPAWCVTRLLETGVLDGYRGRYLEPAAGRGAIVKAVDAHRLASGLQAVAWQFEEIDPAHFQSLVCLSSQLPQQAPAFVQPRDFLEAGLPVGVFDVAITNPPFSLAHAYINKLFTLEVKYIALLLRLNFLGTASRANFLRKHPPDVFVLPDRASFVGGTTDSIEYAWFVWRPLLARSSGELRVLATTPLEERRTT